MPRYTNPADFIIKIAINPNLVSNKYVSIKYIAEKNSDVNKTFLEFNNEERDHLSLLGEEM